MALRNMLRGCRAPHGLLPADEEIRVYIPAPFRVQDPALIWDLAEDIRLGCLMTGPTDASVGGSVSGAPGLMATHLPFLVDRARGQQGVMLGHMARANEQAHSLRDGMEVLVSFLGPNTYISPHWYGTAPRAPTWNYVSVQVRGRLRVIGDAEWLRAAVLRLSATMEPSASPWKAEELDPAYVARLLPGIIGFEIEVTQLEAQLRLSQQNNTEDRQRVAAALARGSTRERQVAEAMAAYLAPVS